MGLNADDQLSRREPLFAPGWLGRVAHASTTASAVGAAATSELEEAKLRGLLRTSFSHAPIGMALVNAAGRIVLANAALGRITALSLEELSELTIADLLMPEEIALQDERHREVLAGRVPCFSATVQVRRKDGSPVWVALVVSHDGTNDVPTLVYQLQDVSERRELESRLRHLVDHDLLTGLFNRNRFEQELERQVERRKRFGEGAAVLMMDLDGFKTVNDELGHGVGDDLLRGLSARLRQRSRGTDVLARLSGDEFAVLLPNAGIESAQAVARQMVTTVRQYSTVLGSRRVGVTASVGVTLFDGLDGAEVLALADAAMYAAKEAGGDRFVVLDPHRPDSAHGPKSRSATEAMRLRDALRNRRFVLHCQPVLGLQDDEVHMHELLIRMRSDNCETLIAPNEFLYAAERFGLIASIDSWVVSEAVALIGEQARRGKRVVLSVNLSGRSVDDPKLDSHIAQELKDSGIDPSCLVFEVTETAAIVNIERAITFSQRLRARGCRFALDDFGAGFASFYYLKRLPFDFLKIDGDFVRGLSDSSSDQLLISAIVMIAKGMGKTTIAECVGDEATRDLLRVSGVDYAQGFHLGRPAPIAEYLTA